MGENLEIRLFVLMICFREATLNFVVTRMCLYTWFLFLPPGIFLSKKAEFYYAHLRAFIWFQMQNAHFKKYIDIMWERCIILTRLPVEGRE